MSQMSKATTFCPALSVLLASAGKIAGREFFQNRAIELMKEDILLAEQYLATTEKHA